jgi:hypothetical protein
MPHQPHNSSVAGPNLSLMSFQQTHQNQQPAQSSQSARYIQRHIHQNTINASNNGASYLLNAFNAKLNNRGRLLEHSNGLMNGNENGAAGNGRLLHQFFNTGSSHQQTNASLTPGRKSASPHFFRSNDYEYLLNRQMNGLNQQIHPTFGHLNHFNGGESSERLG